MKNAVDQYDADLKSHSSRQSLSLANAGGIIGVVLCVSLSVGFTMVFHVSLKVVYLMFGVVIGIFVKVLGKGVGNKFGFIGAFYAVLGVLIQEFLFSLLFVDLNSYRASRPSIDPEHQNFNSFYASTMEWLWTGGLSIGAAIIAFRISKNPMKKDEIDYLLEAKGIDLDQKWNRTNTFRKNRRR